MNKDDEKQHKNGIEYKEAYHREKIAREKVESILESKMRELYLANQNLEKQNEALKKSETEFNKTLHELEDVQTELEKMACSDSLTKLPNRFQFDIDLKREIARATRYGSRFALLYLDLDLFKKVNDTYGHDAGDMLLRYVSARLRNVLRSVDIVARLGGDEFAIILTEIDNSHYAGRVAHRIIEILSNPYELLGHSVVVGASIGVACYPECGTDAGTLNKNADIAMYCAKEFGRSNYQFFTSALQKRYSDRLELEAELHFALERQQFFLEYQPRFDLKTEQIVGMEALLRWRHPTRGVLMPNHFIPMAEETNLIVPIGAWVVQTACKQFAIWRAENANLDWMMAVNVSAHQIQHSEFINVVVNAIQKNNLPTNKLELEITESSLMKCLGTIEGAMFKLHTMGLQFSVDDFGSSYSSLSKIKELPIQTIKIDRSLVKDINVKMSDNKVIKSTIDLAKELGLKVIAEGVETEPQMQFLSENNCPEAQGYLYSKPLSVEQMTNFIGLKVRIKS